MQGFDPWSGNQDPTCCMALAKKKKKKKTQNHTPKQANQNQRERAQGALLPSGRLALLLWEGRSVSELAGSLSALCDHHGEHNLRSARCRWSMLHFLWQESSEVLATRRNQEKKEGCQFLSQCRQKVHHHGGRQGDLGGRCWCHQKRSFQAFCGDASWKRLLICSVWYRLWNKGIQKRGVDVFPVGTRTIFSEE